MYLIFKRFPLLNLVTKTVGYLLLLLIAIFIVFIIASEYILINIHNYKTHIEHIIAINTQYKLTIGSISGDLKNGYLPEIKIRNISITNPENKSQQLDINNMDVVISSSSIWRFAPIFKSINIDGSSIRIERDLIGNLTLNGLKINNSNQNEKSKFDFEALLLKQGDITLSHINLTYNDIKNGIPEMELRNIKVGLIKGFLDNHRLYIDLYDKDYQRLLEAELKWQGGKFQDWQNWKSADLKINTITHNNTLKQNISRYFRRGNNEFHATTALLASMKNGHIVDFFANFDIDNFKVALQNASLVNFPKLGGNISIKLLHNSHYDIVANNLLVVTNSGYLFDNAYIRGRSELGLGGNVELSNTNLVALNNWLSLFSETNGINIDGTLQNIKFKWLGKFLNPKDYSLNAKFNNISVNSKLPEYPSLSHVSGDVMISKYNGKVNLQLENSTLHYNKLFLIPYEFKSLKSAIEWNVAQNKDLTLTIHKTPFETKDFKGWLDGTYIENHNRSESSPYLAMNAHVDRVLTHKVGDYLPKAIPKSVHEWLNMGLAGGYGTNANMILKGPVHKFPFKDNKSGLFYITADLDNAKLQYVKDWPPLENLKGQFIIKNTNITVKATFGRLEKNYLDNTVVVIPDYDDHNGVYLTADGNAHGSTHNFMEYLKKTPINEVIGKLPEKIATSGNGSVKLYLKVPFRAPKSTEVKGTYHFENNNVLFDLPIPEINKVNGNLEFTHHGINIDDLYLSVFNTKTRLSAKTNEDGQINFKVLAPKLDYKALASFYLSPFSSLIDGNADSVVNFTVGKGGIENLTAKSKLVGVAINAPDPLKKNSDTEKELNLTIKPSVNKGVVLNWSYTDQFKGQQFFPANGNTHGQIALGSGTNFITNQDPDSVLAINTVLPEFNIVDWISTVTKVVTDAKANAHPESNGLSRTLEFPIPNKKHAVYKNRSLPLQIQLHSDSFKVGKINWHAGDLNIFVGPQTTYFNLYTPVVSGFGNFNYIHNRLQISVDRYMVQKKSYPAIDESNLNADFINESSDIINKNIPDTLVTINNLFYQNHNLGKVSLLVHKDGDNLVIESGSLISKAAQTNFHGTNYCFGCSKEDSFVDLSLDSKINDFGDVLYSLNFGKILNNGNGDAKVSLQWNGGFQDLNVRRMLGSIKVGVSSGKFIKVDPGLLGGVMSIINLQSIFEFGSGNIDNIFKTGFFFNTLDMDIKLENSMIALKRIYMSGPTAQVQSTGTANVASNTVDASVSVTPHLGFAVAVTAGVATLNPIIGVAVYAGEFILDDPQNKLFTFSYHVSGNLRHPKVERTNDAEKTATKVSISAKD